METFISNIYQFLFSIYDALTTYGIDDFFYKDVFTSSSHIGFNLTWYELFMYVGTLTIAILVIVLFIKFVCRIVGLFRL